MSRISVAIASYNGAAYIAEQLSSILSQLSPDDEVVIIDDCSSDDTTRIIKSFDDQRIKLSVSARNRGVVRTFTEAIAACTGEIIFLADQDDVWFPGKVEAVLYVFESDPAIAIVSTDATVIDQNGNQLLASYYDDRGGFTDSFVRNLLKSRFHGCLMAFRSTLRPLVLPLTQYHDVWIGLCNKVAGGKAGFIPQPFVAYRRHGKNESGALPFQQQIGKRMGLLYQIMARFSRLRSVR